MKKAMEAEDYDNDAIKEQLNSLLESLSENLHQPLPELPEQGAFTKLDALTRERRMNEWRDLYASCNTLRRRLAIKPLLEIVIEVEEYVGRLESMAHEVHILVSGPFCIAIAICAFNFHKTLSMLMRSLP